MEAAWKSPVGVAGGGGAELACGAGCTTECPHLKASGFGCVAYCSRGSCCSTAAPGEELVGAFIFPCIFCNMFTVSGPGVQLTESSACNSASSSAASWASASTYLSCNGCGTRLLRSPVNIITNLVATVLFMCVDSPRTAYNAVSNSPSPVLVDVDETDGAREP